MVYRYCWHNYMVWGGNRYEEIFVGGGANPKKVPLMQGRIGPAAPPPLGRWAPGTTMHFFMNLYVVKHV